MLYSFFNDIDMVSNSKYQVEAATAAKNWKEESLKIAKNCKTPAKVLMQADILRRISNLDDISLVTMYQYALEQLKIDLSNADYHRKLQECIMNLIFSYRKPGIIEQLIVFKINQMLDALSEYNYSDRAFQADCSAMGQCNSNIPFYLRNTRSREDKVQALERIKQSLLRDPNLVSTL